MTQERKSQIIKMMKTSPVVIDNHNNKLKEITGLVEFNNPKTPLACCFDARCYSLNACTMDKNGNLHCSTISIGDVLWGAYPDAEQLKKYNEDCLFDSGKIKCIYRPDGTIIYPAT